MLQNLIPHAPEDIEITGLSVDSREIKDGYLFAALPGTQVDGRTFIPQAIKAGASAILLPTGSDVEHTDRLLIEDDNPRRAFALAAARFYGQQPDMTAAVTGTNGKSSCVSFIRQLWAALGQKAASVGTLGITAPGIEIAGGLTTPDAGKLHARLAEITKAGVTHMAMEASSHGLDQYRLDGVRVQIAGFTNLSRDHLDYHLTMENYLAAKARLFGEVLQDGGTAVLNSDIPEFDQLKALAQSKGHQVVSYGQKGQDIRLLDHRIDGAEQVIKLAIQAETFECRLKLAGAFQIENVLCSLGIVMASGFNASDIMAQLPKLASVAGRMDYMGSTRNGAPVYVDYAHTPDALDTVLKALRAHSENRLHVVFGCGGNRDKGKRAEMGRVAENQADVIIVTDDNPRDEDPALIRQEILSACPSAQEIGDRKQAIETAIQGLEAGDVLVIAGKGHESGQIVGSQVLPFDDRTVAKEVLHD